MQLMGSESYFPQVRLIEFGLLLSGPLMRFPVGKWGGYE